MRKLIDKLHNQYKNHKEYKNKETHFFVRSIGNWTYALQIVVSFFRLKAMKR